MPIKNYSIGLSLIFIASLAQADYSTSSRGYSFSGPSESATVQSCMASPYTSNAECQQNVSCNDDQGRSCQASSRGYSFTAPSSDAAVYTCEQSPYTSNSECQQTVSCGGYGDSNSNDGYGYGYDQGYNNPPPPPPHHPQPPPQQYQPPVHTQPSAPTPSGSYRASCRNISMDGSTLIAQCKNLRGKWVGAELDYNSCNGNGVANNDGQLTCH